MKSRIARNPVWKAEGENRVNALIEILLNNNRLEDLKKAATDKEFQKQLFEEFNL